MVKKTKLLLIPNSVNQNHAAALVELLSPMQERVYNLFRNHAFDIITTGERRYCTLTTKHIAETLGIAYSTAKTHILIIVRTGLIEPVYWVKKKKKRKCFKTHELAKEYIAKHGGQYKGRWFKVYNPQELKHKKSIKFISIEK